MSSEFQENSELKHHIKDTHPTFTTTTNNKLLNMKQHLKEKHSNVTTVITTTPQHCDTSSNF